MVNNSRTLMIDFGVDVADGGTYNVKKSDLDYFEEEQLIHCVNRYFTCSPGFRPLHPTTTLPSQRKQHAPPRVPSLGRSILVAGPNVVSANPCLRNSASAKTAAS
jgi:hypothetical protein